MGSEMCIRDSGRTPQYGDFDCLDGCALAVRLAHLDTASALPASLWPAAPVDTAQPRASCSAPLDAQLAAASLQGPAAWLALVCRWPAEAMGLQPLSLGSGQPANGALASVRAVAGGADGGAPSCAGQLRAGSRLSCVAFDARSMSELFARPHSDRAVVVDGELVSTELPDYAQLDDGVESPTELPWAELARTTVARGGTAVAPVAPPVYT